MHGTTNLKCCYRIGGRGVCQQGYDYSFSVFPSPAYKETEVVIWFILTVVF